MRQQCDVVLTFFCQVVKSRSSESHSWRSVSVWIKHFKTKKFFFFFNVSSFLDNRIKKLCTFLLSSNFIFNYTEL